MNRKSLLIFGLFALTTASHADMISVRDKAIVDIRGSQPSTQDKKKVRELAADNAWKRYQAQNFTAARSSALLSHAAAVRAQRDVACTFEFYEERVNPETRTYEVSVRAACNKLAVDAFVNQLLGTSSQRSSAGRLPFTFMFMARRAADATEFLDKVRNSTSVTVGTTGDGLDSDSKNESAEAAGVSVTQTKSTETKGTVSTRDTQFTFVVEQSEGVDNAVTNVLVTAGYDVAKYSDVLAECPGVTLDEVVTGFANPSPSQAELLPAELRRKMIRSAKQCEMAFFAVGLLDVLKSQKRPDGLWSVTVALTMDVRDVRKSIPTAVASIPPVQFEMVGRDRIEAANMALTKAAESGTREVVDLLLQRGIQ